MSSLSSNTDEKDNRENQATGPGLASPNRGTDWWVPRPGGQEYEDRCHIDLQCRWISSSAYANPLSLPLDQTVSEAL
jgi:hypothetical protein